MKLADADKLALRIADVLSPFCSRIDIAGSIRRRRPEVGEIDIVCLPKDPLEELALHRRCSERGKMIKSGEQYAVYTFGGPTLAQAFHLDLWFAHNGTNDLLSHTPSNYGMLLLSRTGSALHNIYLAKLAKTRGLKFSPDAGLLDGETVVASETEEEIFDKLGIQWIPPAARKR